MSNNPNNNALTPQLMQDFHQVYGMILSHRKRAAAAVDNEMLLMIWEVGGYVSHKLHSTAWGEGVVRQLSDYIRTQDPTSRGWSYRTIYKMVQLYETYSRSEFTELVSHMKVSEFARPQLPPSTVSQIVPIEMAQIHTPEIVPFEMAQIPNVVFATGWTNHQIILSRCKTDEERLFYMLYANREPFDKPVLSPVEVLRINSKEPNGNILYIYSSSSKQRILHRQYHQLAA